MESRDGRSELETTKKAYQAPKLVRLGSVRDLTFGTSKPSKSDGTLTRTADK